ncbi:Cell wall-active antibiotics response 4TMS YvqF [Goodfellowiella coeruleoviolacea]|uniref:Cell wall-active antibiotics response 4TMS YvqF n=1 Tax=Goodfellowiella coeruleoviolacea TaxID=334858 RepID=A0AAE3KEM0_9PSEU|nr:Cell wall-active antibiotics response 4TMS YvqF [Goodfellowiella coeruleoviolacea]
MAQALHQAMGEGRLTLAELDDRLQRVYQAKTFAELAPLTSDLPGHQLAVPHPAAVQPVAGAAPLPASARVGGTPGPSTSIAVMSGASRKGEWVVPVTHTAVAVMGGVEIDLTHARFEESEVTINVFAFWGGVEITVPEDVAVRVDGVGFMGAFEDNTMRRGGQPAPPGAPTVRVTGLAMMAGVEVRRPRRKKVRGGGDRGQIEE